MLGDAIRWGRIGLVWVVVLLLNLIWMLNMMRLRRKYRCRLMCRIAMRWIAMRTMEDKDNGTINSNGMFGGEGMVAIPVSDEGH